MAVSITRAHPFDHATARQRVQTLAETLGRKLNLRYTWEGDRLTFKRTGAKGHIDVRPNAIHVEIRTSRLLPISESRLREQVEAVLDEHIPPASAGGPPAHRPAPASSSSHAPYASNEHAPYASNETARAREPSGGTASPSPTASADGGSGPSARAGESLAGLAGSLVGQTLRTAGDVGAGVLQLGRWMLSPEQLRSLSSSQQGLLHEAGGYVRRIRERTGLSVDEAGARLGLPTDLLAAAEQGRALLPPAAQRALAALLAPDEADDVLTLFRRAYASPAPDASSHDGVA